MDATAVLELLVLGALMGMLGQGARAVVGLKTMTDYANAQGVGANDLFEAGRLITSMLIGTLVGLASALVYYIGGGSATDLTWHVLVGWAGAAYAGTDALEGFISQYMSPGASDSTVQKVTAAVTAKLATAKPAYSSGDAWTIVLAAFTKLGKPNVQQGDLLSALGYSGFVPVLEVWDAVNNQLPSTRQLDPTLVITWQAKTTTVLQVVQAVEAV
jgi:hypothetical protein